jgi:hypothetical protein
MRSMVAKRLGLLTGCLLAFMLTIGAVQAGAAGSTKVLTFYDSGSQFTGVGFDASDPNAVPPIGAHFIITIHLKNIGSQFGKPSGTIVGRVLLDCTVLVSDPPQTLDGICDGIAHVPDGFFTFVGNGGFSNAKVNHYAITGGVGPYANDRGQIKVVNSANGGSSATVTLSS